VTSPTLTDRQLDDRLDRLFRASLSGERERWVDRRRSPDLTHDPVRWNEYAANVQRGLVLSHERISRAHSAASDTGSRDQANRLVEHARLYISQFRELIKAAPGLNVSSLSGIADSAEATRAAYAAWLTRPPAEIESGRFRRIPFDEPTEQEQLFVQLLNLEADGAISDGPAAATGLSELLERAAASPPNQTGIEAVLRQLATDRASGEATAGIPELMTLVSGPNAAFESALRAAYSFDRSGAHGRRFLKRCLALLARLATTLSLLPELTDAERTRLQALSPTIAQRQSVIDAQIDRAFRTSPWTTAAMPGGTMEST
jgi:hypothetical protein